MTTQEAVLYRPQHTLGHKDCPVCNEHKRKLTMTTQEFATLPFEPAAEEWLRLKTLYQKPGTIRCYQDYLMRLKPMFTGMPLSSIHIGHLVQYQISNKGKYSAGSINHDLNTLSQMLTKADLWEPIKEHYQPLPLPKWTPPRVLTEQQKQHLFAVASSDPSWSLAYWVALLSSNTSATGCELRSLQHKHIDLESVPPILYVPSEHVKNEFRARVIPLNEHGFTAMKLIIARANSLGSTQPAHYLFPYRLKTRIFDPNRQASNSYIKKQWKKMVIAAGFPWLRPHDMRHQIITELLEGGTPEQTVMSICGHVRREAMEHYSHQRIAAKAQALDVLVRKTS